MIDNNLLNFLYLLAKYKATNLNESSQHNITPSNNTITYNNTTNWTQATLKLYILDGSIKNLIISMGILNIQFIALIKPFTIILLGFVGSICLA